jgi:hypothetical protein
MRESQPPGRRYFVIDFRFDAQGNEHDRSLRAFAQFFLILSPVSFIER